MFHKKLIKTFKKIELHKKKKKKFFLYLLIQNLKNNVKFFCFFLQKNLSFSFISYYLKKSYTLCNKFSLKICYLMLSKYL